MEKISAKKYIETRARTLPIYKCFVNKDWETAKIANILVMRQHVTKNITLGFYLIDLMCLGVKDTYYKFNLPENEAEDMLEEIQESLEEIDYTLAHNIIFAGYDFAMEFDLPPHKDFSLTKNILEEDDDNVPLIEVNVGEYDGKPHLVLGPLGEGRWALEKLRKNPGEGNYYYTDGIADDEEDLPDDEYEGFEDEDEFDMQDEPLESFPMGTLSAFDAREVRQEDLLNLEKLNEREPQEMLNLTMEMRIRHFASLPQCFIVSDIDLMDSEEYELLEKCDGQINSANGQYIYIEEINEDETVEDGLLSLELIKEPEVFFTEGDKFFEAYSHNFYALIQLYHLTTAFEYEELRKRICKALINFVDVYPLAELYLAFDSACFSTKNGFENILNKKSIKECFPEYKTFGEEELLLYFLAKLLWGIENNIVEEAIFYYKLSVDMLQENSLFVQTQIKLADFLDKKIVGAAAN